MTDSTDNARWPERAFLFDYDLQDESGDWKTLRGWSDATPAPMQSREYIRADLATQPDPMGAVKVKPLVWEDFDGRGAKASAFYSANYLINLWNGRGQFEVSLSYPGHQTGYDGERWHDTLEAAKAAAQADYEARILSALEHTQPDPLADPRVVALVDAVNAAWAHDGEPTLKEIARILDALAAFNTTGGKDE